MFLEETDHKMLYIAILRPSRGFGELGRKVIYLQGAGEHWKVF